MSSHPVSIRLSSIQSVTGLAYGLDDRGSILGSGRNFSLRHRVHAGSGAYSAPYTEDNGGSLPWSKFAGA
jgi:hypothetical protein